MAGALALLCIFAFMLLGTSAARTIIGFTLLSLLPTYLFFDAFSLRESEKAMFALCASSAFFPSLTYWLGFLIPFTWAIFLSSALLFTAAFLGRRTFKRSQIRSI